MNSVQKHKQFFASANGYGGFRSYFDDIFKSEKFTKIFVLKGGPGTDKSTFIKRMIAGLSKYGPQLEEFVCSSDRNSLDGVIARFKNACFAIVDGTAPHERDAIIPGAVDEVVNLGECFDINRLESARDDIIALNRKKSCAYKEAYSDLAISSFLEGKYEAEISKIYDYNAARAAAIELISEFNESYFASFEYRLISSFSKSGYDVLKISDADPSRSWTVFGDRTAQKIFMKIVSNIALSENKCSHCFPNCLAEDAVDAIRFSDSEYVMTSEAGNAQRCFDTDQFVNLGCKTVSEDYLATLREDQKKYEELARKSLEVASEYHFKLEEIYTPAVNFSKTDDIYNRVFEKIISLIEARNSH